MDGDATRVHDELRRSKGHQQNSVKDVAQVWQQGLSLPGITPLAGALAGGRTNRPLRVQAMRDAQSIYGNSALRRSLSRGASLPVQRETPEPYAVSQGYLEEEEVPQPYAVSGGYVEEEDDVPQPYAVSQGYVEEVEDGDDIPQPYAVSEGYPGQIVYDEPFPGPALDAPAQLDQGSLASAHAGGSAAVAAASAPSSGAAQGGRFSTLPLGGHYQGEDVKAEHYRQAKGAHISTRYLRTEEERSPYRLDVGAGGKIMGSDNAPLSTGTAKGMFKGGAGGQIFVMSPEGQFYSASAQEENRKGGLMGRGRTVVQEGGEFVPANNAPSASAQAFHHSSFLGGGAVASAGELKANQGVLSLISNASGHYKPGSEHVMQALQQLEGQGVATEQARVHLMGDFNNGVYDNSKEVTPAVGEYKAAGGNRDTLVDRHNVLKEMRRAFGVMPDDAKREPQLSAAEVLQNLAPANLQNSLGGLTRSGGLDEYPAYSLGGGYP
jgi:hypothetical protein